MEKFSYAARASSSFLQNNARTKKFNQQNFTKIRNTTGKKSKWSNNLTIYPNRVERLWLDGEKFCFPALRCFRTVDPKDYRMLWDVLKIRVTSSLLQFTWVIKLCEWHALGSKNCFRLRSSDPWISLNLTPCSSVWSGAVPNVGWWAASKRLSGYPLKRKFGSLCLCGSSKISLWSRGVAWNTKSTIE